MSFYRDVIRIARKEHKCTVCHGIIKIGEKYHDKAGNSIDDEKYIWWDKECVPCQAVIHEFLQSSHADEGYCDEYIQDWWRDVMCYDCKHYYLPCKPDSDCEGFLQEGSCSERTKYGTCKAGDTCGDMTHYCRCEKYEKQEE